MQTRVRQQQFPGRLAPLALRIQRHPRPDPGVIGQNGISQRQKIEVECPHTPTHDPFTGELGFKLVQSLQNLLGGQGT